MESRQGAEISAEEQRVGKWYQVEEEARKGLGGFPSRYHFHTRSGGVGVPKRAK